MIFMTLFVLRLGFAILPRLTLNSWVQVIFLLSLSLLGIEDDL
jgi:hypothetical protein